MKYSRILLAAAVLGLLPATGFAQAKQTPAPPPLPIVIGAAEPLSVGDVIFIEVGGHADLDQTVGIEEDGKITLHEFGQFTAAGKTRAALRTEIQVAADKTLNNAPVFIVLREHRGPHITIDGNVSTQGNFAFTPGMKLLDAISDVHGLFYKPNRYKVLLIRNDKTQTLDISKIYSEPDGPVNISLMPNDRLVFNEIDLAHRKVTVLGQIGHPSTFEVDNDTTVLTLLGQAGGLTQSAALTQVFVTRDSTKIPLNLRPVLINGIKDDAILNFRFQDGDVLSVPGVQTKYQVLGQVGRPATYLLPEQATVTVLDALNAAGGATPKANMGKAVIRRLVNGKQTDIKVDFAAIQKKGQASANVLIQADDTLIIPERGKPGLTLGDVLAPVSLLNILGFRIFGR